MTRIANRDARKYVQILQPFEGSNLFAYWISSTSNMYAVFSYGRSRPLWIWLVEREIWVGNSSSYSRVTSIHRIHTDPKAERVVWLPKNGLQTLLWKGPQALSELIVNKRLMEAYP